jgi:glycosyltransferase involved in cell wall biosynthesis
MQPKVSVIIPAYNQAHYLSHAIQSVLAQSFTHWEAIIVDDGSTDNTQAVAASYASSNIHYIYQANQGLSAARNTGIRAACGDHLAFLDSDDELEPEFLQSCLAALTENRSLAAVYTQTRFIDQSGQILPRENARSLSGAAFQQQLRQGGFFPPVSVLVRSDVVREAGLFDTQLTSLEDWDLWLRVSNRYPMQGLPVPLVRYRVYPGSMSTNAGRMHANRLAVVAKQVGPPDGDMATWMVGKLSMYGFAYFASALDYLQQKQPDTGWDLIEQAILTWPALLTRIDTFYEIACGDQIKGFRGQAALLDIQANGTEMLRRLESLFTRPNSSFAKKRRVAYGNAYLALGMLSDQANNWKLGRRYLLKAMVSNPRLLGSASVIRRALKLWAGHRLVRAARLIAGKAS